MGNETREWKRNEPFGPPPWVTLSQIEQQIESWEEDGFEHRALSVMAGLGWVERVCEDGRKSGEVVTLFGLPFLLSRALTSNQAMVVLSPVRFEDR